MSLPAAMLKTDLLVTEPGKAALLAVEVKRRRTDESNLRQISDVANAVHAEFVMIVDPQQIVVAPIRDGAPEWSRAVKLSTPEILGQYADATNLERVEEFYLESLVEAWLRDFAHAWKSSRPPGSDELDSIGLAKRLPQTDVHSELRL